MSMLYFCDPMIAFCRTIVIRQAEPETIYCIVERYISDWGDHQMNVDTFCSFFSLRDNTVANYIDTP